MDSQPEALAEYLQLLCRRRATGIAGDEMDALPALSQPARQLGGRRRLAAALYADQENHARSLTGKREAARFTQRNHQLPMHNLHDLLGGVQRTGDLIPERLLANRLHQISCDLVMDIGLKQRQANLS